MSKFITPFRHHIWEIFQKQIGCNNSTNFSRYYLYRKSTNTTTKKIKIIRRIFPIIFLSTLPRFSVLVNLNKTSNTFVKNAYDFEKEVSEMITKSEELIIKGENDEAKAILKEALKLCQEKQIFGNISAIYELLASLAYREGAILEAENMIVEFIEKLIQLGYPDNHNSIIRFKLKLARLYQSVNNNDMAELGYRECITMQEQKINKTDGFLDETTNTLYCNALFWYARLMQEKLEFKKAKIYYKKTLDRLHFSKSISASQKMVVMYYLAEVLTKMGDLDTALNYLYKGLDVGINEEPNNPDTPIFVIQIGLLHMMKGLYDNAEYWCKAGAVLADDNKEIYNEAKNCLDKIAKLQQNEKFKSKS